MEQYCRDGFTHNGGNSKADPYEISHWDSSELNYLLYSRNRRNWSFAFTHASTSSKCILFAIRCLSQIGSYFDAPWDVDWIVNEMIDWLKVCDPPSITELFFDPDIWEEPNSGPSTAGSADCLDGRCTPENRKDDSNSEAKGE